MKARKFELKELTTKTGNQFRYRDVLVILVSQADADRGIPIVEMRKRIKFLDAIEAANGVIHFNSEGWEDLREKANRFPWGMASREIISFIDDLEAAPEVELTEA